ncbi:MAG: protein kinase [Gammaproteobacteria bacterium]|nr:protein kinase [Gammaproteobacteria bacterium]
MKLSLGQRIFVAFSALLVIVLGLAVGITYYRGNVISQQAVAEALASIRTVQQGYESQRFRLLRLISEIFAADPYFSSYVAEAAGGNLGLGGAADTGSIVDLLTERQQDLGFDFAMVLSGSGQLIARTEGPEIDMQEPAADPVVGPVIESLESATGYWFRDSGAFQIAVVPLADEETLVGFLVTGLAVDEKFAEEIKRVSGSELAFLRAGAAGFEPVVGTLDDQDLKALLGQSDAIKGAVGGSPVRLQLGDRVWLASVAAAGDAESGGVSVALTSLDEALANFRAIENALLIVAAISLIIALPLSLLISRGVLAPVRRLSTAAQSAARGDYQQHFTAEGRDEVAQLTGAFDSLLSDLREKRDMQGYLADLAKFLPDTTGIKPGARKIAQRPASSYGTFALVGIDLRRFAKQADKGTPEETFILANVNLQHIESLARSQSGRIVGMLGHRVVAAFEGQDSHKRALAVAGSALTSLASQGEGTAAAVVIGKAASGAVQIGEGTSDNVLGLAVYQLDRLLQEAASGLVFFTREVADEIRKERAEFKPGVAEGLVSKGKFYALKAAEADVFQLEGEGATVQDANVTRAAGAPRKAAQIMPGTTLGGRYEILAELGAGGMGVVYKAHDHELNDLVALKMLHVSGGDELAQLLEAMKSEIKLARKISHPNVLRTHDFGQLEGVPYISMEYVRGLTLKYLLNQSGRIPYSAGLHIAKQVAAALQAAHGQGVLHRDIKPENVILENNGNAKLMDFGIASQFSTSREAGAEGAVVGTPRYAPPEQLEGKVVDVRADVYAAGVLMYQMYTGEFPFAARRFGELVKAKTTEDPTPPSAHWKEIPKDMEALIMRCIARKPEDRISSAEALLSALEKLRA